MSSFSAMAVVSIGAVVCVISVAQFEQKMSVAMKRKLTRIITKENILSVVVAFAPFDCKRKSAIYQAHRHIEPIVYL